MCLSVACFVYVWFSFGRFGVAVFLLYPALVLTVLIAMDFVFFQNETSHNWFFYLKPCVGKQKSPTLIQKCLDWRLYFAYSAGWGGVAVLYNFSGAE